MISSLFHKLMVPGLYILILFKRAFFTALSLFLALFLAIGGYGHFFEAVAEDLSLQAPSDSLNAVLLMDSSASMLVNDPAKLRDQGARLLLQFLKPGDNLAIVSFDESAQVVRALSPFNSDQLPAIQSSLNGIEALGQYTDLNAGLQAAQNILSKVSSDSSKPVIILLSDGKMDPAPNRGTAETHLDELTTRILPTLKGSKTKVYTLAFSQDADRPLLQHIAQATEGVNWFTPNSDTIHESFADLFLSLKKPQVVPYGAKGFKIDADVEEATFYINQPEDAHIEIEDPDEERFSAQKPGDQIRWFDGKKFSVITISQPQAGEWKIIGVNPEDGFATILTNLKLVTDWPNAIPVDETVLLQARLYEGKIPVDLEAMAQAVSFAFQVTPSDRVSEPIIREFLNDEGKNGDEKAKDGIFSQRIKLSEAGEYRLRLVAKGPTFERQLQLPFRVRPPLVSFTIEQNSRHAGVVAEAEEDSHNAKKIDAHTQEVIAGSQEAVFRVSLNDEASTFKNTSVVIAAIDKDRNKYSLVANAGKATHPGADLIYQASAAALPKDGVYELRAYLEAKSRDGQRVSEESELLRFSRKSVIDLVAKPVETQAPIATDVHKEEKPVEGGFEWIALIIVTVLNLALGGLLFMLLKKKRAQSGGNVSFEMPELPPELSQGAEELDKRAQIEAVNLDDERYILVESEVNAALADSSSNSAAG